MTAGSNKEHTWPVRSLIIAIASIILTQIAIFSTSIYLHRTLAHRALSPRPIVDFLFRAALWLLTGQDRQQWVAVHRKHHTFTDKEGDPHSPLLLGFWKVQLWNVYYYIQEARNPQTIAKFAPDLGPDRLERAALLPRLDRARRSAPP